MNPAPTCILVDARTIRVGDTINTFTHLAPRLACVMSVRTVLAKVAINAEPLPCQEFLHREIESGKSGYTIRLHGAQIWKAA